MIRLINDEQGVIEIRGVVTYAVNDARASEFDEMPVLFVKGGGGPSPLLTFSDSSVDEFTNQL